MRSADTVMLVSCLNSTTNSCSSVCPLKQWVAAGHDHMTTLGPIPHDDEVIAAARVLLGMGTATA